MSTDPLILVQQPVGRGDVPRVDFQLHTTWTDGRNTSREIYDSPDASMLPDELRELEPAANRAAARHGEASGATILSRASARSNSRF